MDRSIKLIGSDEGIHLFLDDNEAILLKWGETIDALAFYDALDYHPGDVYAIEETECSRGPISDGAFAPFKELCGSIVKGINEIAESDINEGNEDSSSEAAAEED